MNTTAGNTGPLRRRDSAASARWRPDRCEYLMRAKIVASLLWLAAVLLCTGEPAARASQETPPSEYQLKAAFLYNFAKFVEWPPEAFPDATTPFTIGIIGENPFDED